MDYKTPSVCPVCSARLDISRLTCPNCHTEINGRFKPCKYCALDDKMQRFLEVFLKSGGNIKEVERTLSISYPTVKSLLNELLKTLFGEEIKKPSKREAGEILDMLENQSISVEEAAALLSGEEPGDNFNKRSDNDE